jgi:hypothetical protein
MAYELADGTIREYPFGLTQLEFMGEVTAGRVILGPRDAEPLLGVTASNRSVSRSTRRTAR